jgi:hypothetical protein
MRRLLQIFIGRRQTSMTFVRQRGCNLASLHMCTTLEVYMRPTCVCIHEKWANSLPWS